MIAKAEKSLLHVAIASNATVQQPPRNSATGYATGTQQTPAKPASLLDIARNKLRNKHATSSENSTQQAQLNEVQEESLLHSEVASNLTTQQAQDDLAADYAELIVNVNELCRIAGYSDDARERMLSAMRNLHPFRYAEEAAYFRLQVERVKAGAYWDNSTSPDTHGRSTAQPGKRAA